MAARLRFACLPTDSSLDASDFTAQPGVVDKLVRELASLRCLDDATVSPAAPRSPSPPATPPAATARRAAAPPTGTPATPQRRCYHVVNDVADAVHTRNDVPDAVRAANDIARCPHCRHELAITAVVIPADAAHVQTPEVIT